MTILLSGGTGYVGSHTAVTLLQSGYEVVLYDNLSNSCNSVIEQITQIAGTRPAFVHGDVRDRAVLDKVLSSYGVEAVIHFAGLKAVGESVDKPVSYYANNVQGTISLLESMQSQQIKKLVFSSSATVYGHPQVLPLDEDHPLAALTPYGRSKLYVEQILTDLATADPEWRIACLRYFNPVGAHNSGLIGENPNGVPNNLMPYIAQVATGQRAELRVFGDDYPTADGTGIRDYIHVMDLAEGHEAALRLIATQSRQHTLHPDPSQNAKPELTGDKTAFENHRIPEVFEDHRKQFDAPDDRGFLEILNLGTGRGYSVLEVVTAFEKAAGRTIPYRITPRRPGDVAVCYACAQKARSVLGFTARRTLDEICTDAWRFQNKNHAQTKPETG